MFTLQFAQTTKARNSTFVPPVTGATTQVLLREETSVVEPTFRMRLEYEGMTTAEELFQYNYCYCPDFKRYYFITNITSVTAVVFDIDCICDVLATFREDIFETNAFVMYAESHYNSAIADGRLPRNFISDQHNVEYSTGFTDKWGCYCFTVASEESTGDTGAAQSYILTQYQMATVASQLYSTDFYEQVIKYLTNPLDSIISCMWTPITGGTAGEGLVQEINISGFYVGEGRPAKRTISGEIEVDPYIAYRSETTLPDGTVVYSYADYRNVEPYAEYNIWLPGAGLVQFPMRNLMGHGSVKPKFKLQYSASPCSGDITYNICRENDAQSAGALGSTVESISGNFGIQVPVAQKNTGYVAAIGNAASAIGSTILAYTALSSYHQIGAIAAGMNAASNAGHAVLEATTASTRVAGTLGGWAATEDMNTKIIAQTTNYQISDSPSAGGGTIGRPLYQTKKIGDMSGLVKCTGAYVKTWATEREHNMIAQYVNSSTNFIFGGLIVE